MGKEGYGPNFGSAVHRLNLTSILTPRGFLAEDHLSGSNLPPITLEILDLFGQRITAGTADAGALI